MPTRSQRIRQATRGGPIDKLKAEVVDLKEQVKEAIAAVRPSHEIHDDGTYSNHKTTVSSPAPVKRVDVEIGQLVSFDGPYAAGGYVYQIGEGGFWTRPRQDYAPDISACRFWAWEYASKHLLGRSV